jgi:hypothetical protein
MSHACMNLVSMRGLREVFGYNNKKGTRTFANNAGMKSSGSLSAGNDGTRGEARQVPP